MKIFLIISIVFNTIYLYGQFGCEVITNHQKSDQNINVTGYIPDANTSIKYIRVNIHYILRSIGDPRYPGNFTATGDGDGVSSYNGYTYAEELIGMANYRLDNNHQMRLPTNNSTSVVSRKYRYVINGVFFHENNNFYYYPSYPNGAYDENAGECINLYFNHSSSPKTSDGHAVMDGNRWVEINSAWENYVALKNSGHNIWIMAQILNHEIGHNLSLNHTVLTGGGTCDENAEDYCADTPTGKFIRVNFGIAACCGWNCPTGSNNMMDYSGDDAITPQQLGRVHWTIVNEIPNYQPCHYRNNTVNITSVSSNKSYIGENVIVPSGSSIVVNNNRTLFIDASEFVVNGEFEIGIGSSLIVKSTPKCN